jgi:transposase-like protein
MPIIQEQILTGSAIRMDAWKACGRLILNGYDHYRVYHNENEFAGGKCHINGIEAFWSFAKRRLAKFNGCASQMFLLYLKETEFRFNHRNENLLNIVKKLPKNLRDARQEPLFIVNNALRTIPFGAVFVCG